MEQIEDEKRRQTAVLDLGFNLDLGMEKARGELDNLFTFRSAELIRNRFALEFEDQPEAELSISLENELEGEIYIDDSDRRLLAEDLNIKIEYTPSDPILISFKNGLRLEASQDEINRDTHVVSITPSFKFYARLNPKAELTVSYDFRMDRYRFDKRRDLEEHRLVLDFYRYLGKKGELSLTNESTRLDFNVPKKKDDYFQNNFDASVSYGLFPSLTIGLENGLEYRDYRKRGSLNTDYLLDRLILPRIEFTPARQIKGTVKCGVKINYDYDRADKDYYGAEFDISLQLSFDKLGVEISNEYEMINYKETPTTDALSVAAGSSELLYYEDYEVNSALLFLTYSLTPELSLDTTLNLEQYWDRGGSSFTDYLANVSLVYTW
ncbi:MAG: hypothetical protein QME81_09105 [bacterium]|nr:hypothetical protein [bacterium]